MGIVKGITIFQASAVHYVLLASGKQPQLLWEVKPPLLPLPHHPCECPLVVLFCCSHAIVSSTVGPEYYVGICSFVDKTQLEPGCTVLLHNKVTCTGLMTNSYCGAVLGLGRLILLSPSRAP